MVRLDADICYQAICARDARFDGRFFVAVTSTGIYCRPICPARTPKRANVEFHPSSASAEAAGFRACRRCRPDTVVAAGQWQRGGELVARALRCMADRDAPGVADLAARLCVGARQLQRLFQEHLGASPVQVAQTQRLHFARKLLEETDLPMTAVAFAAGFASVRRFNALVKECSGCTPGVLRGNLRRGAWREGAALSLSLPYRPPFDYDGLLAFLAARAIDGVEHVSDGCYRRTVRGRDGAGIIEVSHDAQRHCLRLHSRGLAPRDLPLLVERVRDLFDLRADPASIHAVLDVCPQVGAVTRRRPGLRVPGAIDGFELAVRAILGQQVSVRGAATLAGRLVARVGEQVPAERGLDRLFPTAAMLAESDLADIGLTRARVTAIRALALAVAQGELVLDVSADPQEARRRLVALPGIGPWTAEYIAMRACRDPDAFPADDLVLRQRTAVNGAPRRAADLLLLAEAWRPWRAYAALALWSAAPTVKEAP